MLNMYMYIYYIYVCIYIYITCVCVCVCVCGFGGTNSHARSKYSRKASSKGSSKVVIQRCELGAHGPFGGAASIRGHTSAHVSIRLQAVAPLAELPERSDMSLNRH